jgi:sugar O-acyltransferase (sialic acid O-acetyltransferase NeuD family)
MTKQVIIIGVGGYSANLVDMMRDANAAAGQELWRPAGFLDDDPRRHNSDYYGLPVLGSLDDASRFSDAFFINAIGSTKSAALKSKLIERVGAPPERFVTLIHSSAYVSSSTKIGPGTTITQNCVVMANVTIGMHVKILPMATISYGCNIGDFSTIAGGSVLAADVRLGGSVYVGANSAIREFIEIGENTIIGMGAMVIRNVPPNSMVGGIPARPLAKRQQD